MRIELAGSIVYVNPLTLTFESNQDFDTLAYLAMGFTNFEVIVIGGGGGRGGGIDTANTGTLIRNYGGEGGGGGLCRVEGVLVSLPNLVPVVVGAAGSEGTTDVVMLLLLPMAVMVDNHLLMVIPVWPQEVRAANELKQIRIRLLQ